jgi:glycosyltransferase involved in cell wall biosynthesis
VRVAVFSDSLPPRIDGIAVVVRHLVDGLIQQGHEVLLIGPGGELGRGGMAAPAGLEVVRLPSFVTPLDGYPLTLPRRAKIARALAAFAPEVISIQTVGPVALLGLNWAAAHRVRTLVSWHTDFEAYARNYSLARILALSVYLALRQHRPVVPEAARGVVAGSLLLATSRVAALCAPSSSAVQQIRDFGVRHPVFLLPADVTPDDLGVGTAPAWRALDRVPGRGTRPYLLYVGRLSREKNLGLLLAAFERLMTMNASAQLVLAGPTHDPRIRALLRPYLRDHGDRIVAIGAVPRPALGEIYRHAAAFVTPSVSETQCLCVSEAIAVGTPVLAVDPMLARDRPIGAVRVVEPRVEQLAAAMLQQLSAERPGIGWPGAGPPIGSLARRFVAASRFVPETQDGVTYRWEQRRWSETGSRSPAVQSSAHFE